MKTSKKLLISVISIGFIIYFYFLAKLAMFSDRNGKDKFTEKQVVLLEDNNSSINVINVDNVSTLRINKGENLKCVGKWYRNKPNEHKKVKISNDTLYIDNTGTGVSIYITLPELRSIVSNKSNIRLNNSNLDDINIHSTDCRYNFNNSTLNNMTISSVKSIFNMHKGEINNLTIAESKSSRYWLKVKGKTICNSSHKTARFSFND